ncbi:5-oxoprolinase subunit PxpA [Devosia sp.]|uniref:5-oxoprolinase subunit PxpA n=1 Tax=Devosia sp. TaxID=1871048 RepID=UPI002F023542
MTSLDLNADLGEGMGADAALLELVSSASVACGGHAGDEATMRATVRAAKARGVAVGAHPGFADREHFGRRRLLLPPAELDAQVRGQVRRLVEIAVEEGVAVRYVKLHGALANMAAEEPAVAAVCFAAVAGLVDDLAILALDNSAQVQAAEALGFRVIREAYADRAYRPDGLLVPRAEPGAVLHDPEAIAARAVRLAQRGEIVAADGSILTSEARSLCVHGDTPEAVAIARRVRQALHAAGIAVASTP